MVNALSEAGRKDDADCYIANFFMTFEEIDELEGHVEIAERGAKEEGLIYASSLRWWGLFWCELPGGYSMCMTLSLGGPKDWHAAHGAQTISPLLHAHGQGGHPNCFSCSSAVNAFC